MLDDLAVHDDIAGIRAEQAVRDVHERGLAGPVLAEESDHLPAVHGNRHVVVCEHTRKTFRDVAELQRGSPARSLRFYPRTRYRWVR